VNLISFLALANTQEPEQQKRTKADLASSHGTIKHNEKLSDVGINRGLSPIFFPHKSQRQT
jgi:hypothetical protein